MRLICIKLLLFYVCTFTFTCCSTGDISEEEISKCEVIMQEDILPDDSPPNECNFNVLYRYNGILYFTCVCCECNKFDMAFGCNGLQLCDFSDDCMIDFNNRADFIGYFL